MVVVDGLPEAIDGVMGDRTITNEGKKVLGDLDRAAASSRRDRHVLIKSTANQVQASSGDIA